MIGRCVGKVMCVSKNQEHIFSIPFCKTAKANLLKKASPLSEEEISAKDEHWKGMIGRSIAKLYEFLESRARYSPYLFTRRARRTCWKRLLYPSDIWLKHKSRPKNRSVEEEMCKLCTTWRLKLVKRLQVNCTRYKEKSKIPSRPLFLNTLERHY